MFRKLTDFLNWILAGGITKFVFGITMLFSVYTLILVLANVADSGIALASFTVAILMGFVWVILMLVQRDN